MVENIKKHLDWFQIIGFTASTVISIILILSGQDQISSVLLGIGVAVLIQLLDMQARLGSVENKTYIKLENVVRSLNGADVKHFTNAQEMWLYLAKRVREAQKSIDDMTISAAFQSIPPAIGQFRDTYRKAELAVQSKKSVRWREVLAFPHYLGKAETKLTGVPANYHIRYYELDPRQPQFPLLQFMIVDAEELIFSSYGNPEDTQTWISVKHPDIVDMFQRYYEFIWRNGKSLADGDKTGLAAIPLIRGKLVQTTLSSHPST